MLKVAVQDADVAPGRVLQPHRQSGAEAARALVRLAVEERNREPGREAVDDRRRIVVAVIDEDDLDGGLR